MTLKILDIDTKDVIKEEHGDITNLPRIGEAIEIPFSYNYNGEHRHSNKCGRIVDIVYKPLTGSFNDWFKPNGYMVIEILCKFYESNNTKYE